MDREIPAVFGAGVFHPLEPVDLAQGTQVSVHCPIAKGTNETAAEESMRAWREYLDRMELLPEEAPRDDFSNRDHDRVIYGG